jgi:hypothetical protein
MTDQHIIEQHSTPGLQRHELTRSAKKDQLNGMRVPKDERDKILEQLYGPEVRERPDHA